MTTPEALVDLRRMIVGLGPYIDQVVLCGGWAAWLYWYLPGAEPGGAPLITDDIDWASPIRLKPETDALGELIGRAGFHRMQFLGAEPPVTKFQHERFPIERLAPIYAEFLVPLRGREVGPPTVEISPGVTAQKLRFLDLALWKPLTVELDSIPGLGEGAPAGTTVRIPHPANYLLHKALVIERRVRPDERDKDCAYWYEVARTTHTMWPEMSARVQELRVEYPAAWFRTASEVLNRWFLKPRAEGPTLAARVIRDQLGADLRPDAVKRVVRRAVDTLGLGLG